MEVHMSLYVIFYTVVSFSFLQRNCSLFSLLLFIICITVCVNTNTCLLLRNLKSCIYSKLKYMHSQVLNLLNPNEMNSATL